MPSISQPSAQNESWGQRSGDRLPLIVLLGPTAVGKSDAAIFLASNLNGEIVSADSRLLYRGMDIGTAKPTLEEREQAPHHLIDVANPDETWSLAKFQNAARKAIQEIHQRKRLPILVGGTGQYIYAIIEEWELPKVAPDPALRFALEKWAKEVTPEGLCGRLKVLDPLAASRMDPRNTRRIVRALEVIFSTGYRFSDQRKKKLSPYRVLNLGLIRPRNELYQRIDDRIQKMIEAGFVHEVQYLLEHNYPVDSPAFSAIGYREVILYLQGAITLDEAVVLMKSRTRKFVRRQANWFKQNASDIHWFTMQDGIYAQLAATVRNWLTMSATIP
jgi:tRNA dimethylallyltransferase